MEPMPENAEIVRLSIELIGGEEIDDADLDNMTRSLRSELEELPFVQEVEQKPVGAGYAAPPKGTKTGELLALGVLAMAVLPTAIPALIGFLQEWGLRPGNRPVRIKVQGGSTGSLEVEFDPRAMSADEVKVLVSDLQALLNN